MTAAKPTALGPHWRQVSTSADQSNILRRAQFVFNKHAPKDDQNTKPPVTSFSNRSC